MDLLFYVIGSSEENELILVNTLTTFFDTVSIIVRKNVEKKAVFDKMDYIILAADELIDDGFYTFISILVSLSLSLSLLLSLSLSLSLCLTLIQWIT